MKTPLISICIPTYNGENFIRKCIESCLVQSYSNFEIIVSDDLSTDNTFAIVKEYQLKDQRVKLNKNTSNLGLVGNWNAVLKLAQGEYVKWLFQDDWMEPTALEEFISAALKGFDFVVSKRNFILDAGAPQKDVDYYSKEVVKLENYFDITLTGFYFTNKQIAKLSINFIALNFIGEPSLTFFKRSLIENAGFCDEKFHQICDLEYNLRLASVAGVYVINKRLCSFAVHANSTTSKNLEEKHFQLRFIEQAYYAYKLLHNKVFNKLQSNLTLSDKFKLSIYYQYRIHEAGRYLSKNNLEDKYSNWLKIYPELSPTSIKHKMFKPIYLFLDIVKRRL